MAQPADPLAKTNFTFADSLSPYNVSMKAWLTQSNRQNELNGIATAIVISSSENKVLLVQRAAHDSMPGRWEVPGGAVDEEDPTILHAAARELVEEAGLVAAHFTRVVSEKAGLDPGYVFSNRAGTATWCRLTFAVEVESCERVTLDPNEHQAHVWATEQEVRDQRVEGLEIPITTNSVQATILEAFRLKRE
ncbi:uncharacterized protein LTR77_008626 [Saxophila tyrrhenica]|uniref:Nudix hydrolase domain-containing protein n=1 Tax=Saxophila tyrrhenica TaxID=1690608 RepID=A0AAV9P2M3_9PEZI|nr:hypothetical protein LTR77_008626 [Saxophila tyrrhenica]